jgi:LmbE family N-acetylglucosaminyl deacetylase
MQRGDQPGFGRHAGGVLGGWFGRAWPAPRAATVLAQLRALPCRPVDAVLGGGTVLVLAPHPDDESLGCGGLIAACCAAGRPPLVVVLTDGTASHPGSAAFPPARLAALRRVETRSAVAALGLPRGRLRFMGLPDGRAPREGPAMASAAAALARIAGEHRVGTILTSWEHDPHPDHVAAHAIARRAAMLSGARLLSYPVWGWALPPRQRLRIGEIEGARLDIAAHLPAKRRAIAAHASQHGAVIVDDPRGFRLPAALLAVLEQPFEVVLQA